MSHEYANTDVIAVINEQVKRNNDAVRTLNSQTYSLLLFLENTKRSMRYGSKSARHHKHQRQCAPVYYPVEHDESYVPPGTVPFATPMTPPPTPETKTQQNVEIL